jgi:hypothetical protein
MKKTVVLLFIGIFILSACFISAPKAVQASSTKLVNSGWSTGTEVDINLEAAPAPFTWMQLLDSDGVKIDAPTTICHPIEPSKYGWVVTIYQLTGKSWTALNTTYAWMPDEEGSYNACAVTYTAGTYALFGYYDEPRDLTKLNSDECDFEFSGMYEDYGPWMLPAPNSFGLVFILPEDMFSLGDSVNYSLSHVSPSDALAGNFSGSTTVDPFFIGQAAFVPGPLTYSSEYEGDITFDVHLYFPAQQCSKNVHIEYSVGDGDCGEGGC